MIKKGQIMSMESYIAIVLIIIVITGFYFVMSAREAQDDTSNDSIEAGIVTDQVTENPIFADKHIDYQEMNGMAEKTCAELQALFETKKNICIYFKDQENNTITIRGKTGLGCKGLNISTLPCGEGLIP